MKFIKSILALIITLSLCIAQDINISGTVTGTGGTAIAGAAVMMEIYGYKDTTDASGNFILAGTGVINEQMNQPVPYTLSAIIKNGLLCLNVQKKLVVEIITYTLQGKIISAINKTMDAGIHSIALPQTGAGIYFYKIKTGSNELVLKSHSIGRVSAGTMLSLYGSSSIASTGHKKGYDPINDVIAITKAGYLNYKVIVTNSDTSSIEIEMLVCADTVVDIDGNVYQAVQIGNQVWMAENLRTTKYNNGTEIPHVTDNAEWGNLSTAAYCYYNNTSNADIIKKYGALYNWHVVNTKKLAPSGWHVSDTTDWNILKFYLIANGYNWDGTTSGNKIAKSLAAQTDWSSDTGQGVIGNDLTKNNRSGFSALGGGFRSDTGGFLTQNRHGIWWCSEVQSASGAWYSRLYYNTDYLFELNCHKNTGCSVRLVKD